MKGKEPECEQLPEPDRIPGREPVQQLGPERDLVQEVEKEHGTNQIEVVPEVSNDTNGVVPGEELLAKVDEDNANKLRTAIMVRVYSGLADFLLIRLTISRLCMCQN